MIEGMVCDMCEAHLNDAIRRAFSVIKVTSSHRKGETVIIAENELTEADLRKAIALTGYELTARKTEPYVKKDSFPWESN